MHYYQKNIGDYAKKTGHLTALEHGVYNLLMDGYYDRERGPSLTEAIRWARARTEEEKQAVLAILDEFFVLVGEEYTHGHIIAEIQAYKLKAETAVANGKKGGRPPKITGEKPGGLFLGTQQEPIDNQEITGSKANQEPITKNQEPKVKASAAGSRLPEDWRPSEADREFCKGQRPDLRISEVASRFYDHWIAQPGAKGRKSDWSATWRNWVRNEKPGNGQGTLGAVGGSDWLKGAI